ncbi:hypothetical protein [Sphingobacterium sp. LRF_L2]|uniref:hypothetical protein n=1 Tax=Sphingobacterium sp. LRF_L2 TaxID=3369421 RepID=UPI003F5F5F7D
MDRATFIKQLGIGTALSYSMLNSSSIFAFEGTTPNELAADKMIKRLVEANNEHVQQLLTLGDKANRHGGRSLGYNFAKMAAAYSHPDSRFKGSKEVIAKLVDITKGLKALQQDDGTLNAGNLESPPDTAFIMEPLCAGVYILLQNKDVALDPIKNEIKDFILKVGEALRTGGVHTPNHRWEICSALAWINAVYPKEAWVDRIDDWLGEGIFIDADGHYPERSMNYSDVENRAFLTIGRLLNRPALYEPVAKNLTMTYYYMEPNGDLVTVDSRRQDQYDQRRITTQYLHYRFLAVQQKNGFFAALTQFIEQLPDFEEYIVKDSLYQFMVNPALTKPFPSFEKLPTTFEKVFSTSSLARIRTGDNSSTIFGGVDWPLIIASGRSVSPNFFSYRKGEAILKHMRMSSRFFSMGHFRSEGLEVKDHVYTLHKKQEAYYFQPLAKEDRNAAGDYQLTPSTDDRFYSKMDFNKRDVSNVKTLNNTIRIRHAEENVSVEFEVVGQVGVAVTVELCFEFGGELVGVEKVEGATHDYFLASGTGTFKKGKDQISFGPGLKKHEGIRGLDGEKYSVHFGEYPSEGQRVFITGYTPFTYKLSFS